MTRDSYARPKLRFRPKNLRNWWIRAEVDDRQTPLEFGPAEKDGGFTLGIHQRDKGRSTLVATIVGYVKGDGSLELKITGRESNTLSFSKSPLVIITNPEE